MLMINLIYNLCETIRSSREIKLARALILQAFYIKCIIFYAYTKYGENKSQFIIRTRDAIMKVTFRSLRTSN